MEPGESSAEHGSGVTGFTNSVESRPDNSPFVIEFAIMAKCRAWSELALTYGRRARIRSGLLGEKNGGAQNRLSFRDRLPKSNPIPSRYARVVETLRDNGDGSSIIL